MCEIDADVVFHEFFTKASQGNSLERKKLKKKNVFILFDRVNQLGTKNVKTVYVLDGDYLRPSFKKQLLYETQATILHHLAYGAMMLFRAMKLRFLHHAVGSMWWVAYTTSKH